MRRAYLLKCLLLLSVSTMSIGCLQIPVQITGLEGEFNPTLLGLIIGEEFVNEEVRIPTGEIDLSQLIEDAQEAGGVPDAVSVDAVLVDSVIFVVDEGSSFDFITSVEILFVPEGMPDSAGEVLASATSSNGFGDVLELTTNGEFDLLPFVTNTGGNTGEIVIRLSGTTPQTTQTWITTINMTLVVRLGGG